jgi:hypothetical protein
MLTVLSLPLLLLRLCVDHSNCMRCVLHDVSLTDCFGRVCSEGHLQLLICWFLLQRVIPLQCRQVGRYARAEVS